MIPSQAQTFSPLTFKPYSMHLLRTLGICLFCFSNSQTECIAQAVVPAARLAPAVVLAPGVPVQNDRDLAARRWVRGLIQQELHALHSLCKLNPQQAKDLVNTIESQWKSKLASTFRSYTESNQRGGVDFEHRVENAMKAWVQASESITPEQKSTWDEELNSRNILRQKVVIGKMISDAERKYGLTSTQMAEAEKLILERWKEAWWVMYRHGTTPETKFAWISPILSESQRTAGGDPGGLRQEYYTSGGATDLPSKGLNERLEVAGISSDESISIDPIAPAAPKP